MSLAAPHLRGPELVLQHPHLLLQLGDHLPAIAGRGGLGVLQPELELVTLSEGGLGSSLHRLAVLLLSPQLLRQPAGVAHRLLAFLL